MGIQPNCILQTYKIRRVCGVVWCCVKGSGGGVSSGRRGPGAILCPVGGRTLRRVLRRDGGGVLLRTDKEVRERGGGGREGRRERGDVKMVLHLASSIKLLIRTYVPLAYEAKFFMPAASVCSNMCVCWHNL